MKGHEGRPMDAEAVPNLLGDVKKWIKTIKGWHGKYREGLYGLLNSTYVNGSDIT
ncbi:hypothetical protein [Candidatus Azobacteroides pseudotrichonymphae]|uniref:hypothetical protein n=1 Tax=Candidatus Azobacteroides pseudotrichonymphae TaxID=511435 RepID=UPI00223C6736|nr:hypothetical protein [Candidatus Azobacteroides pseudotrichonymphae]